MAVSGPDVDMRFGFFSLHSVFQKIKLVFNIKIIGNFFFLTENTDFQSLLKKQNIGNAGPSFPPSYHPAGLKNTCP